MEHNLPDASSIYPKQPTKTSQALLVLHCFIFLECKERLRNLKQRTALSSNGFEMGILGSVNALIYWKGLKATRFK